MSRNHELPEIFRARIAELKSCLRFSRGLNRLDQLADLASERILAALQSGSLRQLVQGNRPAGVTLHY
jgi:hypothetical protein